MIQVAWRRKDKLATSDGLAVTAAPRLHLQCPRIIIKCFINWLSYLAYQRSRFEFDDDDNDEGHVEHDNRVDNHDHHGHHDDEDDGGSADVADVNRSQVGPVGHQGTQVTPSGHIHQVQGWLSLVLQVFDHSIGSPPYCWYNTITANSTPALYLAPSDFCLDLCNTCLFGIKLRNLYWKLKSTLIIDKSNQQVRLTPFCPFQKFDENAKLVFFAEIWRTSTLEHIISSIA